MVISASCARARRVRRHRLRSIRSALCDRAHRRECEHHRRRSERTGLTVDPRIERAIRRTPPPPPLRLWKRKRKTKTRRTLKKTETETETKTKTKTKSWAKRSSQKMDCTANFHPVCPSSSPFWARHSGINRATQRTQKSSWVRQCLRSVKSVASNSVTLRPRANGQSTRRSSTTAERNCESFTTDFTNAPPLTLRDRTENTW
mmetsp:Transcript_6850/g.27496  ORF Transcript_6850/g.27496 Transcript_6850/m.27496 type:complete len:203 (-) Transcript_6850:637-1245(-)